MKRKLALLAIVAVVGVNQVPYVYAATGTAVKVENKVTIKKDIKSVNYASMILESEIEDLLSATEEYKQSNPKASEDKISDYFIQLVFDKYNNRNQMQTFTTSNYLPTVQDNLGPTELNVFNSNPFKGVSCLTAGKSALSFTSMRWKDTYLFHNDNADAYRHSLWNAFMANSAGSTYAKQFADAHEKDFPNGTLETSMDLYNNARGREIGSKSYSGSSAGQVTSAIEAAILNAVKGGVMRRYVGGDIGTKTSLVATNSNGSK